MEPSPPSPTTPSWIYKRDGRLVPFDSDKISRSLFAAGESLSRTDPFLARELTDSIVHFLAEESFGAIPNTAQLSEIVEKVVRELGHPALSRTFAGGRGRKRKEERLVPSLTQDESRDGPKPESQTIGVAVQQISRWLDTIPHSVELARAISGACLHEFAFEKVFSKDLVAAHNQRFIHLGEVEAPLDLAGLVVGNAPAHPLKFVEQILQAGCITSQFVAITSPEYHLSESGNNKGSVDEFIRALHLGLQSTGLRAVVNLNSAEPPASEKWIGAGPLFPSQMDTASNTGTGRIAEAICAGLLQQGKNQSFCRVDWHLAERDFRAESLPRLHRVARRILDGAPLAFVMDRSRTAFQHAEGLKENVPAVLLTVGVILPAVFRDGTLAKVDDFFQKVRSLVRLAVSAGVEKRNFLRKHASAKHDLTSGFMLERARLLVAPIGINECAEHLIAAGALRDEDRAGFLRRAFDQINRTLLEEARHRVLDACVDSLPISANKHRLATDEAKGDWIPWSAGIPPKKEARRVGKCHSISGGGTLVVRLAEDCRPSVEELALFLLFAWQETSLIRLRFEREIAVVRQLTVPWNGGHRS